MTSWVDGLSGAPERCIRQPNPVADVRRFAEDFGVACPQLGHGQVFQAATCGPTSAGMLVLLFLGGLGTV